MPKGRRRGNGFAPLRRAGSGLTVAFMGIADQIMSDWDASLAALCWQRELGVEDWVLDAPLNRYDLPEKLAELPQPTAMAAPPTPPRRAPPQIPPDAPPVDAVAMAEVAAARAFGLDALRDAIATFEQCDLRRGARSLVFADGNPKARVLILGEAPDREEDMAGMPFVGPAGVLLDRMFAAIGLSRQSPDAQAALYITNVMPWRPPGNRDPEPHEVAMMRPFVARHIDLVDPEVIVVMGHTPLFALTGDRGILRARGTWATALGRPLLPMVHPTYLLRNPAAKREAWADLLALRTRLQAGQKP